MDFLVREAQPDDAEAIVAIFNPIIEAGLYTAFDTPFTVEVERNYKPRHNGFCVLKDWPCNEEAMSRL